MVMVREMREGDGEGTAGLSRVHNHIIVDSSDDSLLLVAIPTL